MTLVFTEFDTGGPTQPLSTRPAPDPAATGYTEREWRMSGTATDALDAGSRADFATRILVRRPRAADFSGVVVIEWLNVSVGAEAAACWATSNRRCCWPPAPRSPRWR